MAVVSSDELAWLGRAPSRGLACGPWLHRQIDQRRRIAYIDLQAPLLSLPFML